MAKALAGLAVIRHIHARSSIPGGRCSQGGVKIPTGGKGEKPKPASAFWFRKLKKKGQQIRCDSEADG
jgi:hypothetical protein